MIDDMKSSGAIYSMIANSISKNIDGIKLPIYSYSNWMNTCYKSRYYTHYTKSWGMQIQAQLWTKKHKESWFVRWIAWSSHRQWAAGPVSKTTQEHGCWRSQIFRTHKPHSLCWWCSAISQRVSRSPSKEDKIWWFQGGNSRLLEKYLRIARTTARCLISAAYPCWLWAYWRWGYRPGYPWNYWMIF